MLYTPQRRHVVSNISALVQLLNLTEHLLSPNLLILVLRITVMIQINAAGFVNPERSLLLLAFLVTILSAVAASLHLLEWAAGSLGGRGLILDFILYFDALLWTLQITALTISYVNNRGNPNPTSRCPWKDPLLPSRDLEEEVVQDMEDGLRAGKRDDILDEELWLDEQEEELDQADERGRLLEPSRARRRRETPLIMSLSLAHMLHVIYRLPTPLANSTVIGSIITDTPRSPSPAERRDSEETVRARTSQESRAGAGEVVFDASDAAEARERETDQGGTIADATPRAPGRTGRIPGEYWVTGPDRR